MFDSTGRYGSRTVILSRYKCVSRPMFIVEVRATHDYFFLKKKEKEKLTSVIYLWTRTEDCADKVYNI